MNALLYDVLRDRVFRRLPHPLPWERTRYASPEQRRDFVEKMCPLLGGALGAEVRPEHAD